MAKGTAKPLAIAAGHEHRLLPGSGAPVDYGSTTSTFTPHCVMPRAQREGIKTARSPLWRESMRYAAQYGAWVVTVVPFDHVRRQALQVVPVSGEPLYKIPGHRAGERTLSVQPRFDDGLRQADPSAAYPEPLVDCAPLAQEVARSARRLGQQKQSPASNYVADDFRTRRLRSSKRIYLLSAAGSNATAARWQR